MGDEYDEEERLLWKLKVGLRVRRFNLKLHLQNRLFSSWKLHRFSFLVRFRKHYLKIDSQSKPDCVPKSRFGFLRSLVVLKFLRRREVVQAQVGHKKKLYEAFGAIWNRSLGFSNVAGLVGAVGVATLISLYFILRWI